MEASVGEAYLSVESLVIRFCKVHWMIFGRICFEIRTAFRPGSRGFVHASDTEALGAYLFITMRVLMMCLVGAMAVSPVQKVIRRSRSWRSGDSVGIANGSRKF